ncbi:hypothetical protein [Streptomyces sp. NPDC096132]|uniref:hypothetical protein n=1 Tax=Streptomyces sp. NPDC096132 TaxID=3366075 RepID=UPI0038009FC1
MAPAATGCLTPYRAAAPPPSTSAFTTRTNGFGRALPTVYITGGAQGCVPINTVVRAILPWLLPHANVIHQCGATSNRPERPSPC